MKRSSREILKGGVLLSAGTLATRLLGFVREILAAAFFGAAADLDAFVVAFTVPNLFRRVFGEEMFERAFLPRYRRLVAEGRRAEARSYLLRILGVTAAGLAVTAGALWLLAPRLVPWIGPGLSPAWTAEAIRLARILVSYLVLVGLATFAGALLLFSRRQLLYALAPAAQNAVVIAVLVVLYLRYGMGVASLAVAWIAGGAAFLAVQLPAAWRIVRDLPARAPGDPPASVRPGLSEGSKILVASVFTKAVTLVDRAVGSLVGPGAIASLYLAFRIVHLPFSIAALAIGRSIAPELSRLRARREPGETTRLVHLGIDLNLFVLGPVVLFLAVFARDVVAVFYMRGAFGADSLAATTLAFTCYAPAILPMGLVVLFGRVYAAQEDNRLPLLAAIAASVVNVTGDVLLFRTPLAQGGIALASVIAFYVQITILLLGLGRVGVRVLPGRLIASHLKLAAALGAMAAVLWPMRVAFAGATGFTEHALALLGAGLLSFGVYGLVALVLWRQPRPRRLRVVLTGGGTGGHVYPALAILEALEGEDRVAEALYLGVRGRAEEVIVPRRGIPLAFVPSAPILGGSTFARVRAAARIGAGVAVACWRLLRFRPHLVVATGGWVSAPVVMAAFLLRPVLKARIVIHEQNIVPGLLNKAASMLADVVAVSFRESAYFIWSHRCVHAGYPVRRELLDPAPSREEARRRLGIAPGTLVVLAYGGSMGSRSINRALADLAPRLLKRPDVLVVHGAGLARGNGYDAVADTAGRLARALGEGWDPRGMVGRRPDGSIGWRLAGYLHDLPLWQRAADVVVTRAGAGALAELGVLGRAAVLVPKRGLSGDHQELGAIAVAERGAAEVVFERRDPESGIDRVDPEELLSRLERLLSRPEEREKMEAAARGGVRTWKPEEIVAFLAEVLEGVELDWVPQVDEPPFVRFQRTFDSLVAFLDAAPAGSLFHRLYDIKVEEYLRADDWLTVNRGIKLVGALRREDLYPFLRDGFPRFRGFLRRNALAALGRARRFQPWFAGMILAGLRDSYWEVRREAVALYRRYWRELEALDGPEAAAIRDGILARLHRRRENFEVRAEALRAAVFLLDEEGFHALSARFLWARNERYREALLDAVQDGLAAGRLADRDRVRRLVKRMLITSSSFRPQFVLRERFLRVVRTLEAEE